VSAALAQMQPRQPFLQPAKPATRPRPWLRGVGLVIE
jgi:hypothetical protein